MAILIFWWMLLVWAALIIGYFVLRYWLSARRKRILTASEVPVAHTVRLTDLPEYVAAFKRYRLLTRLTAALLTVGMLSAILLTARPAVISIIKPVQKNRDIMLCLDASGSVLKADTMLINRFNTLVSSFNGQRFGLTLFNSSAVTIIPLNDNYQLITEQLRVAGEAFQAQKGDTFTKLANGTLAGFSSGTSLTSDGLASCIQHMGDNSQARSQSIVLATDNEVNGTPIVGMTQAIEMARERDIRVFVIDPGVSETDKAGDHGQLKIVADQTDGSYYLLNDPQAVNSLVDAITEQEPASFVGLPQPANNDSPKIFLYAAVLLTVASLALLWRLEL